MSRAGHTPAVAPVPIESLVTVRPSARAQRMALRYDPHAGIVYLVLPHGMPLKRAYDFANSHRSWIMRQLSRQTDNVPFADSAILPILGQEHRIYIDYDPAFSLTQIEMRAGTLHVRTNKDSPERRIELFLMRLAQNTFSVHARAKAKKSRKSRPLSHVQVRDTKSRWGSCSSKGGISLSWRLIFAPPTAMDYVISHEVAHLTHMNHSPAFWSLCESLCDDFLEGKDWIRTHGHTLLRYGRTCPPPSS